MQEGLSAAHVLDRIREMIGQGELAPGSRLPPERELAERLRVNRGTLRKALARLEYEGAITRHVGRGTFIGHPPTTATAIANAASPMELMDARCALEPVIAREAALRARKEQLRRLQLCVVRGDDADAFEDFEKWDILFHRTIAEATQNPIFVMVMEVMRQMRTQEEWERLKRSSFSPALRAQYRSEHRAILQALEQRDPAGAAEAMSAHTRSIRAAIAGLVVWNQDASAGGRPHSGQPALS